MGLRMVWSPRDSLRLPGHFWASGEDRVTFNSDLKPGAAFRITNRLQYRSADTCPDACQTPPCVQPTKRSLVVWVVQNLAQRPPDVCDALPEIGQASADLLSISLPNRGRRSQGTGHAHYRFVRIGQHPAKYRTSIAGT